MKKKMLITVAASALTVLAYAPVASADWQDHWQPPPPMEDHWQRGTDWRPSIRDRIISIRRAIHNGVERGDLTRTEADRARYELDSILDEIDRMKSDGYFSERERSRVIAQLDGVSRDVWRLEHNDTARY